MAIKKEIENLIEKIIGKKATVEMPDNFEHGDFSTNAAIKEKLNSQEIAEQLHGNALFDKAEVVNGFINFFLSERFLLDELQKAIREKEKYGQSNAGKGKTIVIDYSEIGRASCRGIGHLRSTIIGQAIYNLYKFLGYKCIGDNHLGDWGTQFGKLVYQIELKIKNEKLKIKELNIEKLERLYVEFHRQAKEKPEMEDEARKWFKKLEDGDKQAQRIWRACVEISMKEFNRIYDLLGVKIDFALGESFYQGKMQPVVEEMKKKGLIRLSEGAWVMEFPDSQLPSLIAIKSDQGTTYFLRDLATIKYRFSKWKPDIIAYEVGTDQTLYFRQLFKATEMLGWTKDVEFIHIAHGLMRTETGKFSTRKGDTVHLEDVLQEAVDRAGDIINNSETSRGLSETEKHQLAKQVGIGAVKYNDLSQHHLRDIVFGWDKIVNLKGNSGPYLQYTYARCQSVLQKAGDSPGAVPKAPAPNEQELKILRELVRFPEIVQKSAVEFSPNLLCNYIFKLAQDYNLFYDKSPIIKAPTPVEKQFRLCLTFAVGQVIKTSLGILGIKSPNKM
ncbi:MAG: arginine--tRNA ligase [Patescibacteria group bacterium]|nr:arginine--tRNA ligase [Patescibacteria group bacterium]